jgi:hypothetical protein
MEKRALNRLKRLQNANKYLSVDSPKKYFGPRGLEKNIFWPDGAKAMLFYGNLKTIEKTVT